MWAVQAIGDETNTIGLDGLSERCAQYYKQGDMFALSSCTDFVQLTIFHSVLQVMSSYAVCHETYSPSETCKFKNAVEKANELGVNNAGLQ